MKLASLIAIISLSVLQGCITSGGINRDYTLIIPGQSAEGFSIGETIDPMEYKAQRYSGSFSDIFEMNILGDIRFDSVIYTGNSSVLFLSGNSITAIVGLDVRKRTTSDGVLLSKGINNFILNYGNDGLETVKIKNHSAYIYRSTGMAVFDDSNDNNIDMYLIFR